MSILSLEDEIEGLYGAQKQRALELPLQHAIKRGQVGRINQLVAQGADVNPASRAGESPLEIAMYDAKFPVVKTLLDYNANPNVSNELGFTPLHSAAYLHADSILVGLLIYHGAHLFNAEAMVGKLHELAFKTDDNDIRDGFIESAQIIEKEYFNLVRRAKTLRRYEENKGIGKRSAKFYFNE